MGRESLMPESNGPKLIAYVFFRIEDMDIFLPAADFPLMDGYSEAVAGLFTICL